MVGLSNIYYIYFAIIHCTYYDIYKEWKIVVCFMIDKNKENVIQKI